jgi:hypothetical protein
MTPLLVRNMLIGLIHSSQVNLLLNGWNPVIRERIPIASMTHPQSWHNYLPGSLIFKNLDEFNLLLHLIYQIPHNM